MIEETDKRIIQLIQGDLPLDPRPFAVMAERIGIREEEFLERVKSLKARGIIRRFAATLRHQEAGYSSNAMVAWIVPVERLEEVGRRLSEFREVTHCYHREPQKGLKFNLYSMIHGENREACHEIAARMSRATAWVMFSVMIPPWSQCLLHCLV